MINVSQLYTRPGRGLQAALPVNMHDALEASKIAAALTHSFRSGHPVYFDDVGQLQASFCCWFLQRIPILPAIHAEGLTNAFHDLWSNVYSL
jgi:hypothetical protein